MSRVGLAPIELPDGVQVTLTPQECKIKGKLGEKILKLTAFVKVKQEDKTLVVEPANENEPQSIRMWGTTRANINQAVLGVTKGFQRQLEVKGVGYRANLQGTNLVLTLGKSHEDKVSVPQGLKVEVDAKTNIITISGHDKQKVGAFAAKVRSLRKPEPYGGTGVRYTDEYVEMKEGKKK